MILTLKKMAALLSGMSAWALYRTGSYRTLIKHGLHFNTASLTLGVGVHHEHLQNRTNLVWLKTKVSGSDLALQLDSGIIKPFDVVRDLGVPLDTELSMKQHITRIASNCFYHLRRI